MRGSWKIEPGVSAGGKTTSTRPLHQFRPLSTLTPLALSRKASSTSLSANVDHESDVQSDAEDQVALIQSMRRLTVLDKGPGDKANRTFDAAFRFHGKSINYNLVAATREMKTKYFLESMGVDVDTMAKERPRTHNPHAQAMEDGLRRPEYWQSPDVSIRSPAAARHSPTWLSLGAVPPNYLDLMLCLSSGNSSTKGNPLPLKPSRDFFNTGHRRI